MKVHLTGIGGVGMAGLAVLLKRRGHAVSGCDLKPTARTRWLEARGIPVAIGHDAAHVAGQDLVIVTPAVAKDNPEYVTACKCGGNFVRSRGHVLARLVSETADSIAVCGSHGKTTTATFIAKLLIALGEPVEWAIGGETGDFPVAGCADAPFCACPHAQQVGANVMAPRASEGRRTTERHPIDSPVLVVEADESDGTLAEYAAKTLVVTNCEYDHPDHFRTRDDYIACYDAARAKARDVVEGERREDVRQEARDASGDEGVRQEARDASGDLRLKSLVSCPQSASCLAPQVSCPQLDLVLAALAPHNRRNALLAVEVARRRGHALEAIAAALPAAVAQLPDRRFQRIWPLAAAGEDVRHEARDASEDEGVRHEARDASGDARQETREGVSRLKSPSRLKSLVSCPQSPTPLVYTDYAHHPTEMACAVQMARAKARGRLTVLFQPHRYSRTKALLREFPAAFAGADEVILCPTYAAFENPIPGGDVTDLYAACQAADTCSGEKPPKFALAPSCAAAWEMARASLKPGDLVLLLGAGDIIDLVPEIRRSLLGSARASCANQECAGGRRTTESCSARFLPRS